MNNTSLAKVENLLQTKKKRYSTMKTPYCQHSSNVNIQVLVNCYTATLRNIILRHG